MHTIKNHTVNWVIIFLLIFSGGVYSQPAALTLEQCKELARNNYPLIQSRSLIQESGKYMDQNIKTGWLPGFTLNSQYTYQSDVTSLPISLPGIEIPEINKEQYKAYAEINQVLYDGGMISGQRKSQEARMHIEQQSLEVQLYALNERVTQLYFGILLLNGQMKQTANIKSDIQAGLERITAAYENGIVLMSEVNALKAELLRVNQRIIEINALDKSTREMLGLFINMPIEESTELVVPPLQTLTEEIKRVELDLFNAQMEGLSAQNKVLSAKNLPKLNLFFQGGYGSPALNMFQPDAETYYITGIRFTYPLTGLYNLRRERSINRIDYQKIEIQRETFLFNTKLLTSQQATELERLQQLLDSDHEIIALRKSIKEAALAQLHNGVITSSDYIREVNAADNARVTALIHEIQLLQAHYNYQLTTGNITF